MAVAVSQQGFPHERTWDEVIVPSLRRRLEDESSQLAKRMSVTSMGSRDDGRTAESYQSNYVYTSSSSRDKANSPTFQQPRPSGIPRPSLTHSRTDTSNSGSSSFTRVRTVSQPFPFDPQANSVSSASTTTIPGTPNPSGSKATRIPVSRGRAGSTSSNQFSSNYHGGTNCGTDSRAGAGKPNGQHIVELATSELYPVSESHGPSSINSRTMRTPYSQTSELIHESAPFNAASVSSRSIINPDSYERQPRPSNESEERPFEHWYRGDVSRNGGVGELRIARKQEMLDIANCGHTLRQASSKLTMSPDSRSRSNSRGREPESHRRRRPRAESLGARESIYIDDDDHARAAAMVLDEQPLTDLDTDGDDDYHEYGGDSREDATETYSPPQDSDYARSQTPTSLRDLGKAGSSYRSRIPTPRANTEPPRTPTPTQGLRGASEPPPTSSSTSRLNTVPTPSHSPNGASKNPKVGVPSNSTAKRKGKSPGPVNGTTNKKPRPSKSPVKVKKDDVRQSVAQYPSLNDDDPAHAIPTWTRPVEANGNWDDVVLPVVARKKGLDGQYEQVDGSPKPRPPQPTVYEPAPGTFGYDHSKYKPPRPDVMDEFGQMPRPEPVSEEDTLVVPPNPERHPLTPEPTTPLTPNGRGRAPSPAPFSQYISNEKPASPTVQPTPVMKVEQPPPPVQPFQMEEEPEAGCCKCIIM